ncbi:winged helix DNA-binding domain-containing protein [Paeniglutamicibacter psychrophenolicus]|uniref:Winged helix DNA-binding domain-containing protein n=1 Tax=Paeniglutamicibacter psychrophenolicus TaxID=257454 RepID=A0ABS4WCM5_9MICC|nr:winged helix DNA-binding domain-containing protein [Paeniglutamicibacter psychrophenolicus]MBP2373950.1 hypothetical protein [Paeniglutamicibacter psychrophenolicus]
MAPHPIKLSSPQRTAVARMRLAAQGLLPRIPVATMAAGASSPAGVVSAMGMVQAQDLPQGCWAVGVRLPGSGLSDIHAALADGSVIRCWGARGTLMLIAPALHAVLLSVTGPRMDAAMAATRAAEGITEAEIARLADVALERCSGAGATRAQLLAAFEQAGSSIAGQRGYHLIVAVSLRGVIVQGPMEPGSNTRQLFMATDQWIGRREPSPDPEEALRLLAGNYIRSHGPATAADCAWWLGMPLVPVRGALAAQQRQLPGRSLGGEVFHFAEEHSNRWASLHGARGMLALPGFDEFLLGYKDRSAALAPEHAQAVTPGKNGIFLRTLVSSGHVVGTWAVEGSGGTLRARSTVFEPAHSARNEAAIRRAMQAYMDFRAS